MFMKEILIFDGDEKGRYMRKIICLLYQSCLSKIVLSNGCDQSLKVNKRNTLHYAG